MFGIDRRKSFNREVQSGGRTIRFSWIDAASNHQVDRLLTLLALPLLRNGLDGKKAVCGSQSLDQAPNDIRANEQLFAPAGVDLSRLIWCQQSGLAQGIDPDGIK